MSNILRTLLLVPAVWAAALVGCDDRDARTDATTAPTAGERVDRGLDRMGDALDRAADRTGDVVAPAVDDAAERARQAGETLRSGARDLAADVSGGIHHVLGEITEAAMTRGGLDDLVERLSEADRRRIGDVEDDAFPQLNAEVDRFRQTWQSKYGRDFDIEDERAVFNFLTIRGDPDNADRATVVFPDRSGMAELNVPVVREQGAWRVDVPDSMTAQQVAENLVSGLRPINAGSPPLPDDRTEALRRSAHGTMAALLGEKRTQ